MKCSKTPPGILSLSNEVICEVLSYCDPLDVAHTGLVCKRLQEITKTRTVWHHQVRGLDVDYAPWVPPSRGWESFTTEELKGIVTDAVKRRALWNKPERMQLVKKSEVEFEAPDEADEVDGGRIVEPRIVPGGKHVLTVRSGVIELWDTTTGEHVWTGESPPRHTRCEYIALDIIEDGKTLAIAAKFRTSDDIRTDSIIRVFKVDLASYGGEVVGDWRFPNSSFYNLFIEGDYFVAYFVAPVRRAIVDWRQQKGVIIDFVDEEGPLQSLIRHAKLTNGHAVAILARRNDMLVFAMPLSLLENHWSDDHDASRWKLFEYEPKAGPILQLSHPETPLIADDETFERSDARMWNLTMHVFTPTWKHPIAGTLESEMFVVSYSQCRGTYNRMLVSYRINFQFPQALSVEGEDTDATKDAVRITQVKTSSSVASSIPWNSGRSIFNSGNIVVLRNPFRCFTLFDGVKQPIREFDVDVEGMPFSGHAEVSSVIDPWTGTIACLTSTSLSTYAIE